MFAVIHEQRHKSIAQGFGCDAQIHYLPNPATNSFMYTSVDNCPENMTETETLKMNMMQQNVETTGYQLVPILMVSILAALLSDIGLKQRRETVEIKEEKVQRLINK